jgi:hypothetical protein
MTTSMVLVQKMADMQRGPSYSTLIDGFICVEFFKPYTRPTWEFRFDGVMIDRRYTAKTAAAFFAALKNRTAPVSA